MMNSVCEDLIEFGICDVDDMSGTSFELEEI